MNMLEANTPFADGIKKIIKKKGMRNWYVAQKAGYSPENFSRMLNGKKLIKACDIPRIAEALGVEITEIYNAGKEDR